jgi:hypothetical protein
MGDVSAAPQNFADRRASRRKKSLLAGKIVYESGARTCDCTIRDISETGARVEIPVGQILPKNLFLIEVRGGLAYDCEVKWRTPSAIGLQFLRVWPLAGELPEECRYLKQLVAGNGAVQPAPIVEITSEMIGAGIAAYGAWKPEKFGWLHTEQEMVRSVYIAMQRAIRKER